MKRALRIAVLVAVASGFCLTSHAQKADLRLNTVVIDAGHGGKDPGTVSADKKTYEKTLTLKISKMLAQRIRNGYPDMKVVMTRDSDVFVDLIERARIASRANANLFISVHINAVSSSKSYGGFSVYILGQSSNKNKDTYAFNAEIIKRENSVIYLEDDYSAKYQDFDSSAESQIFMQLMSNAFREQSLLFSQNLSDAMDKGPFKNNLGIHQGNFAVLRQASMPAVLVELGFMTNAGDLALLRSDEAIEKMVDNMYSAFINYKSTYDESVTGEKSPRPLDQPKAAPKASPKPEAKPEVKAEAKPEVKAEVKAEVAEEVKAEAKPETEPEIWYGTQVMASAKLIKDGDPGLKGYSAKAVKAGNLYKYVVGVSTDLEEAKKKSVEIRKKFQGSFLVKFDGENLSIQR